MKKKNKKIFRDDWKEYLAFSTRERNGVFSLLIILLLQIIATFYLNFSNDKYSEENNIATTDISRSWMQFRSMEKREEISSKKDSSKDDLEKNQDKKNKIQYFKFNPNTAGAGDFEKLGLNRRQVSMIEKYRSLGAGFRTKSDFKKLYCISPQEYLRLEPWVLLPDTYLFPDKKPRQYFKEPKVISIDLSTCDSILLLDLPGIGPTFARRIIKYRTKLGGYSSVQQLHEVWGMNDTLFDKISDLVYLTDSTPGTLHINSIALDELGRHPYIGFTVAKVLINYRDQHSGFKSLEEVKKVPLLTEEMFRKLAPYLVL